MWGSRQRERRTLAALAASALALLLPTTTSSAAPPTIALTSTHSGNVITLTWTVAGGPSSNLVYLYSDNLLKSVADPGWKTARCSGPSTACSTTVTVPRGGRYRFVMTARNDVGEVNVAKVTETVEDLPAPVVTSPLLTHVNQFSVAPQTIAWTTAPPGYVRVKRPDGTTTTFSPSTSGAISVPTASLTYGRTRWLVDYCVGTGTSRYCSDAVEVTYIVGPARFEGDARRFVPTGGSTVLSWPATGTHWNVRDLTTNTSTWVGSPTWTFAATGSPGVHEIQLTSCNFAVSPAVCSNQPVSATAPVAGVLTQAVAEDSVVGVGQQIGTVTAGGVSSTVTAPIAGKVHWLIAGGASVTAGAAVAGIVVDDLDHVDRIEVVVGGASAGTWTTSSWASAFGTPTKVELRQTAATGDALDVAFDDQGDAWISGEYGQGFSELLTGSTTAESYIEPLRRAGSPLAPTRPYWNPVSGTQVSHSTLAEKVATSGSTVWATHGGYDAWQVDDHSRIVRIAQDGADLPTTPYDDRICAVHVPGNSNSVIGASYDPARDRLWFAARDVQPNGSSSPAIYWFADDGTAAATTSPAFPGCDNELDYSSPSAVAAASTANLCTSEAQVGCIHRLAIPATMATPSGSPAPNFPAHLAFDDNGTTASSDDLLWWTDQTGNVLGRVAIGSGQLTCYRMPPPTNARSLYQSFPWQIRAFGGSVYIGEYADSDLVRFDKALASGGPSSDCTTLPASTTAISELHLPKRSNDVNLHSIAIEPGNAAHGPRLWFTLAAAEAGAPINRDASTFGYLDLTSWTNGTPIGVTYSGLTSLTGLAQARHAFRGIDVRADGTVALADQQTDQLIRLSPIT